MTPKNALFLITSRQSFAAEAERATGGSGGTAIRVGGRSGLANGAAAQSAVEALRSGSATAVLVDLDSGLHEAFKTLEDVAGLAPHACVLVASANREPDLILRAMRAGAADFLALPLERGALGEALARAARRGAPGETQASGARRRVMSFIGAKGGCGTTSVAVNLATTLCGAGPKPGRSVILLDLDSPGGDAAAMLKLKPAYSLADVAANIHRLDMELLNSMAVRHESGLVCLAAAEGSGSRRPTPDQVGAIVAFLHEHYDDVVLAGGGLTDSEMAGVNLAHMVHVVTTLDFLALRRAQSIIARLREFGVTGDALRVVVNRFDRGSDLTPRDARQALDAPVVWSIPQDARTADRAVNEGVPYAAKGKTRLQAAFEEYATLLAGENETAPGSLNVGRLFRRLVPGRAGMPA